jgi:hypothetical protein
MTKPIVGNGGLAKVEFAELSQPGRMHQAGVGDPVSVIRARSLGR